MLAFRLRQSVQVSVTFLAMVSGDDQHRRKVRHANDHVDPQVPFLDRGLVSSQVTVDHKQIRTLANTVVHEPLQALSGVAEVPILLEVNVAAVADAEGHAEASCFAPPPPPPPPPQGGACLFPCQAI